MRSTIDGKTDVYWMRCRHISVLKRQFLDATICYEYSSLPIVFHGVHYKLPCKIRICFEI